MSMKSLLKNRISPKRSYTIKEAAAVLDMSYSTVKRYINEGKIQACRLGPRSIRISGENLMEYVEEYVRNTAF